MKSGVIYKITNLVNNKIYIGKTVRDVNQRFTEHKLKARNGLNYHLSRAMRKYGEENFIIEVIQVFCCSTSSLLNKKLDEAEKHYIELFSTKDRGYNMTDGGDGTSGHIVNAITKAKISKSKKGSKNPMYGKHSSMYGKIGELCPLYGRKRSKDTKESIKKSWETRTNTKYKSILRYSLDGVLIKRYNRAKDIEDEFIRSGVYNALRGITSTYKKYIWKYEL